MTVCRGNSSHKNIALELMKQVMLKEGSGGDGILCAGLPNAMGGYDQKGHEMAAEVKPFFDDQLLNAIGGCCGTSPVHIAAMKKLVEDGRYKPRQKHGTLRILHFLATGR